MAFGLAVKPTQPPIQWVLGILSLGRKKAGCEADHLHPSSAKVKIEWSYASAPPPHAFMVRRGTTFPFVYSSRLVGLAEHSILDWVTNTHT